MDLLKRLFRPVSAMDEITKIDKGIYRPELITEQRGSDAGSKRFNSCGIGMNVRKDYYTHRGRSIIGASQQYKQLIVVDL